MIKNHDSIMTYGKRYRGARIGDVPASYLLWIYDNRRWGGYRDLRIYIEDNLPRLKTEAKRANNNQKLLNEISDS
jgi:hypothetical protein